MASCHQAPTSDKHDDKLPEKQAVLGVCDNKAGTPGVVQDGPSPSVRPASTTQADSLTVSHSGLHPKKW